MLMRPIVIDTNIFLLPYQFRVDFLSELERVVEEPYYLVVSRQVLSELRHLQVKKPHSKDARAARLGMAFFEKANSEGKMQIVPSREKVDQWLISWATKNAAIVCTNDIRVKIAAKRKGLPVIGLRGKSNLAFV